MASEEDFNQLRERYIRLRSELLEALRKSHTDEKKALYRNNDSLKVSRLKEELHSISLKYIEHLKNKPGTY